MSHGPKKERKRVLVLGGGIAGLTAAHELAERDFDVEVIERTADPRDPTRPLLGGLAASQWSRAPLPLPTLLEDATGVIYPEAGEPVFREAGKLISFEGIVEPPNKDGTAPFMVHDWPAFWLKADVSSLSQFPDEKPEALFEADSERGFAKMVKQTFETLGESKAPEVVLVATTFPSLRALRNDSGLADEFDGLMQCLARSSDEAQRWGTGRHEIKRRAAKRIEWILEKIQGLDGGQWERFALTSELSQPRDPGFGNLGEYKITEGWIRRLNGSKPIIVLGGWVTIERSSPYLRKNDLVQIRVRQQVLPGEHGYRFFPSFYRNLFDTMERIPILEDQQRDNPFVMLPGEGNDDDPDDDWKEEGPFTVRDNLRSIVRHALALQDENPPIILPRANDYAVTSWLQTFDAMQRLDIPQRDLARANLRMVRFMTSCADRRRTYAAESFREHITSKDDTSPEFLAALDTWPQALAGLRAQDADARAMGSVSLQLALDQVKPTGFRDGTLNAPTSEAWFDHWYEWLRQRYGVKFTVGEVEKFGWHNERGLTVTTNPKLPEADYVVCALDLHAVLRLAKKGLPTEARGEGPLKRVVELMESYAKQDGARSQSLGEELHAIEQASHLRQADDAHEPDKLRAQLAGIPQHLREVDAAGAWQGLRDRIGALLRKEDPVEPDITAEASWRLQAGASLPFRFYGGIQFYVERDYRLFDGHTYYANSPWRLSSISQIQFQRRRPARLTVYRGILSVIIGDWLTPGYLLRKPACACTNEEIAAEVWYQLYRGLEGADVPPDPPQYFRIDEAIKTDDKGLRKSDTPFLVNLSSLNDWWPETPDRYDVHCGRPDVPGSGWVFCGTWLNTYTRMVTMESANESARHAVNAILDREREQGKPRGSNCATYDLEDAEPPDLRPLIALDQELFARGLPHMMDILDVEKALLPRMAAGDRRDVLALLHDFVRTQGGLAAATGGWLLDGLRRL